MSRRLVILTIIFALSAGSIAGKAEAFSEERVPWQPGMDTLFPLPEVEGVVPWDVLGQVEMIFEGIDLVPSYGDSVKALEGTDVRMVGFLLPLDSMGSRLLLSLISPACPFCLPGGPETLVELEAREPIALTEEAVVVAGRFDIVDDPAAGYYYRMTDVTLVEDAVIR